MNDYVVNGRGDIQKGLTGMGFGIWMTQEFADMTNWVKVYNNTQSPLNKIRFFGCDMQWGVSAMQILKDYLEKNNRFTSKMGAGFEALKKYTPTLTSADKTMIRAAIGSLTNIQFTDVDAAQADLYQHDVRQLQQVMDYIDAASTFFPSKQSNVRDKYMAENCEWIYNFTGHNKMMIWAHNRHINKTDGSLGRYPMGMHLAEVLKNDYYAMGFDFSTGKVSSFDYKTRRNIPVAISPSAYGSSGAVFAQCNAPNFILDLKTASVNPVINNFLNKKITSITLGAAAADKQKSGYVTHKLAETFDGVIYIKDTGASMDMKPTASVK